jgi:hypothetical protein
LLYTLPALKYALTPNLTNYFHISCTLVNFIFKKFKFGNSKSIVSSGCYLFITILRGPIPPTEHYINIIFITHLTIYNERYFFYIFTISTPNSSWINKLINLSPHSHVLSTNFIFIKNCFHIDFITIYYNLFSSALSLIKLKYLIHLY